MSAWNVPDADGDALTVVTELVHNVCRHTHNGGELAVTLHRRADCDAVLIEVADADPRSAHALPRDPRRVGGRGLQIVSAIARRWGMRAAEWAGHRGKIVWAELVFTARPVAHSTPDR